MMQSISDIENDVLRLRLKDIKCAFHQAELAGGEKENNFCIPYDNYDAIEVSMVDEIPMDYDGVMGVPITFLYKYNPTQFEIIGFRKGNDGKDLVINGKPPYFRILIKKVVINF